MWQPTYVDKTLFKPEHMDIFELDIHKVLSWPFKDRYLPSDLAVLCKDLPDGLKKANV